MTPPEPPLRADELIRALASHEVDYVIIGGIALAAHGVIRATKDLDIVPSPDAHNIERLMFALAELGAEPAGLECFRVEETPVVLSVASLKEGGNWVLRTRFGRLDIFQYLEALDDYGQLKRGAIRAQVFGLEGDAAPYFAGADDLIRMKRVAGRPQDLIDIGDIQRARDPAPE